ncbi:serine/threonine-protein kinase [Kitasatospora sp. MBT66]|uniref:serine/threonine-protein kinase n=1 Tax=Kitasatospora sp. MBT66 TaxID=1444769 RepID=UPI00068C9992|nr:serine/threonine-protein kinase [Kitasatospora sp. MBT66]
MRDREQGQQDPQDPQDRRHSPYDDPAAAPADGWWLPEYDHERELGAGASGRVWLAHHRPTGTPVAIKYLHDPADGAALRREASVLARVDSPYVTRLYEYVEAGPNAAIVMELVDGLSLRALLRAEGATTPEAALVVLKGSLLGLAAAHAVGLVHRDYKPANVLVAVDGTSKLVDFGIAVPGGDARDISGTPAYLAPEQWTGAPASPTADVYAATVTFFECLTGARPFDGTTTIELAVQHLESPVPDGLVPEAVRPLVRAGMAKRPEERPRGAAEFLQLLETAAATAYGELWEEQGHADLAVLVGLLAALLPRSAAAAPGGAAAPPMQLVAAEGPLPDRSLPREGGGGAAGSGSSGPPRGRVTLAGRSRPARSRRLRRTGAVAGTLTLAVLAGLALAGTTRSEDRTVTGSPMLRITTTLDPADGGPVPTAAPTPTASSGTTRTPHSASPSAPPSADRSAPPSPSPSLSPFQPPSQPPTFSPLGPPSFAPSASRTPSAAPSPSRPHPPATGSPSTGTSTPAPTPDATSSSPAPRLTDRPATSASPATGTTSSSNTRAPQPSTTTSPPPAPVRVESLTVDSLGCLDSSRFGLQARITVVASGPPGATLVVSWQHHSGAIDPPVTVATETVRLGTGSVTLTRSHDFGNDGSLQWGVRVGSDPRPESTPTAYRELPAIDCRQPG